MSGLFLLYGTAQAAFFLRRAYTHMAPAPATANRAKPAPPILPPVDGLSVPCEVVCGGTEEADPDGTDESPSVSSREVTYTLLNTAVVL